MRINYISNIKVIDITLAMECVAMISDFYSKKDGGKGTENQDSFSLFFVLSNFESIYCCTSAPLNRPAFLIFSSKSCDSHRESSVNRDMSLPRIAEALPPIFLHPELAFWSHSNLDEIVLSLRDKFSM